MQTVADAAQQTAKVIEGAKPIASSTVETISSADPVSIAGAGRIFNSCTSLFQVLVEYLTCNATFYVISVG